MIELDLVPIGFTVAYLSVWILSFWIGDEFNQFLGSNSKFMFIYSISCWISLVVLGFVNETISTGFRNEYLKLRNEAAFYDYVMFAAYIFGMLVGILIINQLLTYVILILWESLKKLHQWINQL